MSATESPLFTDRRPFDGSVQSAREAWLFDRYIQSRNQYKADFIEMLSESLRGGPVLELNDGFGSMGVELLSRRRFELHILCRTKYARELAEQRACASGMAKHCRIHEREAPGFPFAAKSFELIYSANTAHEWQDPVAYIRGAWELLRRGGWLVINDLKRDADPFITEYMIREMAGDETEEGQYRLKVFLRTLASAYTSAEMESLVQAAGVGPFEIAAEEPMTFMVRIGRRE